MFDVLIYLFETYIYNELEVCIDQDKLTDDLTQAGFHQDDIFNALNWLEKLIDLQDGIDRTFILHSDSLTMRIYTDEESHFLDTDCRGFLLFLEQIQVLNFETREMVIDRVMALDITEFNLDDLKWIILIILFSIPGYENSYQKMENLVFEKNKLHIH
ncbi:Protein Smg [Candidatus Gullanella endobia]|uniref:Protein Smg n=1 Tax=Candidatus Gullanella endobia TaxID=1070130 RepID=A0A143WR86_9ENTR|nr:DUF494 family protein [Candidatus Gullanella endobia]CUX96220.1 Protein Smg [Candidatus Gullanella endobia]